ncbi:uncharacterized protein A4U43_C05F10140 [Asparagus officinalis]|uniref:Uncharacterized protein n=1 Tax=Asparagus officinalis TaxID=4686 RepID=A0A5P1EW10_ASPOF|nr:uncharacterized protein A4U43_C05F10140 [Asparagus officinalis]
MMYCYWRFFFKSGTGKHFIIPSDGRIGKTLNGYVILYQEGYHNFFVEEVKKLYTLCSEQNEVHDKNASSAKNLDNFKDYREPASSSNSSDEDETRPKTNDNLSSHEDISKQNTSIQQDQIIIVPQMNSKASGSFSSVEQAIQVFLKNAKIKFYVLYLHLLNFNLSCLRFIKLRVKMRS